MPVIYPGKGGGGNLGAIAAALGASGGGPPPLRRTVAIPGTNPLDGYRTDNPGGAPLGAQPMFKGCYAYVSALPTVNNFLMSNIDTATDQQGWDLFVQSSGIPRSRIYIPGPFLVNANFSTGLTAPDVGTFVTMANAHLVSVNQQRNFLNGVLSGVAGGTVGYNGDPTSNPFGFQLFGNDTGGSAGGEIELEGALVSRVEVSDAQAATWDAAVVSAQKVVALPSPLTTETRWSASESGLPVGAGPVIWPDRVSGLALNKSGTTTVQLR